MEPYVHRQVAMWYWIFPLVVILALSFASPRTAYGAFPILAIDVLAILIAAVFSQLTVRVDAEAVRWQFGWGWPAGSIGLDEIASVEGTQTSFFEGFGIHWTIWHGWLWNVAGFQGIAMEKRSGGRVTIGTDDPQGLYDAIARYKAPLG